MHSQFPIRYRMQVSGPLPFETGRTQSVGTKRTSALFFGNFFAWSPKITAFRELGSKRCFERFLAASGDFLKSKAFCAESNSLMMRARTVRFSASACEASWALRFSDAANDFQPAPKAGSAQMPQGKVSVIGRGKRAAARTRPA